MNFNEALKELDKLNLPKDQYAITSSGTLAIRGLREAADLDIIVTDSLWQELSQKYPVTPKPPLDRIDIGNIQILGDGSFFIKPEIATIEQMIKTADVIDGRRFVKLELIKKFKALRDTEKDKKDIELIDQYLKQQPTTDNT